MARMVVICRPPKDAATFVRHSYDVHIPMAKGRPGSRKNEVSRPPIVAPAGWKDAGLVGTRLFDSLDASKAAFASECGKACAADRRIFAPRVEDVRRHRFDDREV